MTDRSDAMFEPFTVDELQAAERAAPVDTNEKPEPLVPVPTDAPSPDWARLRPEEAIGEPVGTWTYHTVDGADAFHIWLCPRRWCRSFGFGW